MPSLHLFDADPDLLRAVTPESRENARRLAVVESVRLHPGTWDPAELGAPTWGALVVSGLLAREIGAATATAAELLGAGDLILPDPSGDGTAAAALPVETAWTVLEPLELALLDARLLPVVHRWPGVTALLLERLQRRVCRLSLSQAISHVTRVDVRVLITLWTLADRWGRVTPEGVVVPIRLTHRTLSRLVGARRPTVTSAISDLSRDGRLARRVDGSWLLHGDPPG